MNELKEWLEENAVIRSWDEYGGIADLSRSQLAQLKGLVDLALSEMKEDTNDQ